MNIQQVLKIISLVTLFAWFSLTGIQSASHAQSNTQLDAAVQGIVPAAAPNVAPGSEIIPADFAKLDDTTPFWVLADFGRTLVGDTGRLFQVFINSKSQ
jgi:hypothetical protein